ncbi:uncharacterized protein LOC114313094 [Camellia sinensis]|uniref:uncharacterized protein LOC114313094 n=1 Tax=Camellia sinensis TaxID=4442 RepID=UPI001035FA08|nr:uncharacterized protein LOC114313094 [Camellia sinensis]
MGNEKETKEFLEEKGTTSNPVVKLPAGLLKKVREPWKKCLIVRLLGRNIGYNLFINRMRKVWNLQADFETLDIGNGFFIVKFEMMEDYMKVFIGGPWVVMDRYVTVRKWQPDFKSNEAEKDTTAIWVRFPNLPIEYYDDKVLYHISKVLSTPLKVDINTAMAARGKYARVCVELDLHKPLISHITIGRYHYVVEYEHLHTLCFSCGRVGHRKEKCTEYPVIQPEKTMQDMTVTHPDSGNGSGTSKPTGQKNEVGFNLDEKLGYGLWTIAPSRRKFQQGKQKHKAHYQKSNIFKVLQLDKDHGENSEGQKCSKAQGNHVDLDMGTNMATSDTDSAQNRGPLDTLVQTSLVMDVELAHAVEDRRQDTEMGLAHGLSGKEELQQANQSSTPKLGPQARVCENISQGNPNSNSGSKPLNSPHSSPSLPVDKPSANRSRARGGKSLAPSKSLEDRPDGRSCRDHSDDRAPCGLVQNAAIFRTRERSISPRRNRLVAQQSKTPDPTMVGDRLAQCETHGACETSESFRGRQEKCDKHSGST